MIRKKCIKKVTIGYWLMTTFASIFSTLLLCFMNKNFIISIILSESCSLISIIFCLIVWLCFQSSSQSFFQRESSDFHICRSRK